MPTCYTGDGEEITISDGLYKDFFDEVFIEEKSLLLTLVDYKPENRMVLSKYIIYRLAEVDPDYLPKSEYEDFLNQEELDT